MYTKIIEPSNRSVHDPSTCLQRPSSAKVPDSSHILTNTFGEIYSKGVLSVETIQNLSISSDVDDNYHRKYVNKLREAQTIKENRIDNHLFFERHMIEAKAKALAYEGREKDKRNKICSNPDLLGIPPTKSFFNCCVDDALLKTNNLLAPSDYFVKSQLSSNKKKIKQDTISKTEDLLPIIKPNNMLIKTDPKYTPIKTNFDKTKFNAFNRLTSFKKESMNQEDRTACRTMLKKYEDKTNFLRNPRNASAELNNQSNSFKIIPEVIEFNKYMIGKVYETTLEIWNITVISQQFRVIPPSTQFFTLSLGQYPQSNSLIAPGMSAFYNIKFAPDSLCSFEDEIMIECSNGTKVKVPILAKRNSPVLSIGPVFDCGYSLVGQIKICRYIIENTGGEGRFAILPKSSWPASNFKTNVPSSTLNVQPFEIQPSIFEVQEGDSFVLEIIFRPSDKKNYDQDIIIACDNCTSLEFKIIGEGQLAQVEFKDGEDQFNDNGNTILIDEFKDYWSNRIIKFPALHPNLYTKKKISIDNKCGSPLDFSWVIYKPILQDNFLDEKNKQKYTYILDTDSSFSIQPQSGVIDRNSTKGFEITFSPLKASNYDNVAHLILHGIPEINKQMMTESLEEIHKTVLTREDTQTTDFIALQMELKGACEPFQFALDPPAIFLPSSFYQNSTIRKGFRLINMSICPINFNWKQIIEPYVIQVEPSYGEIAPRSYALMEVLITGINPGTIKEKIACYIEFVEEPIYLYVEATIKGAECIIHETDLDFGLVKLGNTSTSYLTVENISNLSLNWSIRTDENNNLKFTNKGELNPLQKNKLEFIFNPQCEMTLAGNIEFQIDKGQNIIINCFGIAQKPNVQLVQSQISLSDCFAQIVNIKQIVLCNNTSFDCTFNWGKVEGEGSNYLDIYIEPNNGYIKGNSVAQFELNVTPYTSGELSDIRIPCYIDGMDEPIFLNMDGVIKGITLHYSVNEQNASSNKLINQDFISIDFENLNIGEVYSKYLLIKNESPIKAKIDLKLKKSESVHLFSTNMTDNEFIKFSCENGNEILSVFISSNCDNFVLDEYETISIHLRANAIMWGDYTTALEVYLNDDLVKSIPLKIEVTSSPLKIYSANVTDKDDELPIIRFASQCQGSGMITRKLKIKNLCRCPIEIKWSTFMINNNGSKLIDINLSTDDQFQSKIKRETDENRISMNVMENQKFRIDSNLEIFKLLKMHLTPHYGESIDKAIFQELPATKLEPFGKEVIEVIANLDVDIAGNYEAIFIGYMNLNENHKKTEEFYRKVMFEFQPIKFKTSISIEYPQLVVEHIDDDGLFFDISFGEFMKETKFFNDKIWKKNLYVLNTNLGSMSFSIEANEPFFVETDNNNNSNITLKSKKKQKLSVLFRLPKDKIKPVKPVENETINGSLNLNFHGGLQQKIPIRAVIWFPLLQVDIDYIDFGKVLVGKKRSKHLLIKNGSKSSALWNIISESTDIFICDSYNGIIEIDKLYYKKSEHIVNISFQPKHDETYNNMIIIENKYGNQSFCIKLSGQGSYDEQDEPLIDA